MGGWAGGVSANYMQYADVFCVLYVCENDAFVRVRMSL